MANESQIKKKFIRFGTGTQDVNSRVIPANFTPTNYTPDEIAAEGDDKISAHLKGIDDALANTGGGSAGDLSEGSFSAVNNQTSPANVTGLAFANATVRSFDALVSVSIDATTDLYEEFKLQGIQKASNWEMSIESLGDDSGITFSITTGGQIQYTSSNLTGFVSNTIKYRAVTTTV